MVALHQWLELTSILDDAFAYLLVENCLEVWFNIDLNEHKMRWPSLMKKQARTRREKQSGASKPRIHLVQGGMVDGQMKLADVQCFS